jgi:hypothetical protein
MSTETIVGQTEVTGIADKLPLKGLSGITLNRGGHVTREVGVCAMEAAAWVAGEPHSDHPKCVAPALAGVMRNLNDRLEDAERQKLIPLIERVIGSSGWSQYRMISIARIFLDGVAKLVSPNLPYMTYMLCVAQRHLGKAEMLNDYPAIARALDYDPDYLSSAMTYALSTVPLTLSSEAVAILDRAIANAY